MTATQVIQVDQVTRPDFVGSSIRPCCPCGEVHQSENINRCIHWAIFANHSISGAWTNTSTFTLFVLSDEMKKEIISILTEKGPLSEKKLKKALYKSFAEDKQNDEEFTETLSKLASKGKVVESDGSYSVVTDSSESANKRKRSDSDVKVEEKPAKKAAPAKANTKGEAPPANKFQVEELWKNGEKYWREGSFDPEYLRTNPDKYVNLSLQPSDLLILTTSVPTLSLQYTE